MSENAKGTKRAMGLFIALLMFFSIAGSALYYVGTSPQQNQDDNQPKIEIKPITFGELPTEHKQAVIGSGRILFEYFYPTGCLECAETQNLLKQFSGQFESQGNLVFVELIEGFNETKLQIINQRGSIIEVEENLTADSLMRIFCENSLVQPKECLLLQFNSPVPEVNKSQETNQTDVGSNSTSTNQTQNTTTGNKTNTTT